MTNDRQQSHNAHTKARSRRRGFTLVELIVVIVILAVLATIAIGLATNVSAHGKQSLTADALRALDQMYVDYVADNSQRIPAIFYDDNKTAFPLIDARLDSAGFDINMDLRANSSLGFFLLEASRNSGSVDTLTKSINSKLLVRAPLPNSDPNVFPRETWATPVTSPPLLVEGVERREIVEVVDAWGRPLRFVHPEFDGGTGPYVNDQGVLQTGGRPGAFTVRAGPGTMTMTFRRSYRPFDPNGASATLIGDADEGICPGNDPYFYSVGSDGDPGSIRDNVYTTEPQFQSDLPTDR